MSILRTIARDGDRVLLAPAEWPEPDHLALGVIADQSTGQAWEVPVGSALKGGHFWTLEAKPWQKWTAEELAAYLADEAKSIDRFLDAVEGGEYS